MKNILVFLMVLGLIVIVGCSEVDLSKVSDEDMGRISDKLIVCESPYMRFGSGCCLDENTNKMCDSDETNEVGETNTKLESQDTNEENVGEKYSYGSEKIDCESIFVSDYSQCLEEPASYCDEGSGTCSNYHHIKYKVYNYEEEDGTFTFAIGGIMHNKETTMEEITKQINGGGYTYFEGEYCMSGVFQDCFIKAIEIPTIEEWNESEVEWVEE